MKKSTDKMQKSMEKMKSLDISSSDKTSEIDMANVFSFKRYFINNLDSYHGEYILKEVSKLIVEKNKAPTRHPSQSILGEDLGFTEPALAEQPYEIIAPQDKRIRDWRGGCTAFGQYELNLVELRTVTNTKIKTLENVARIVPKADCIRQMLTCGTVIIDISYDRDELRIAKDYLHVLKELLGKINAPSKAVGDPDDTTAGASGDMKDLKKRYLVLISTVMTWASTKPLDPDTPDMPFIETDFRKRKPHPNYKIHYEVENEVIGIARKHRKLIGALVVATGVTYGGREDALFYWFQKAWESEPVLPILGRGNNTVPLINVHDLASIIYNLVSDFPRKLYILAVEQNVTKQKEIVKTLGRVTGSGMFKCIPPEDGFLIPEIDQRIFDLMTLNLNMEPSFIVETMGLQWASDGTFVDNVPALMKQFKKERALKPFKVVIYGPPIVGKTTLAKRIAETYGLVYISPETVVQDLTEDLTWRLRHWEIGETATLGAAFGEEENVDEVSDAGEEEGQQDTTKQTLALLQSGRLLSDEEILGYLRQRMLSREATNRGWVLDGYPMSLLQCAALFDKGDEQDSDVGEEVDQEPFDEDVDLYSNVLRKMLPDIVVYLESNDDFICEKAMRQPEGDSRLDEEIILKRLSDFRTGDTREITPLNFFDELDIHPLVVKIKDHSDYAMNGPYAAVTLRMGRPCRYGKLLALIEAAEKKEKEESDTLRAQEELAFKEFEQKLKEEREEKMEYWTELYAMLREEEEAALAAAGEPMRNYLVHHIFPTLTPALLEVAKLRPDDPIDFLAEKTFKLNPFGSNFQEKFELHEERMRLMKECADERPKEPDLKYNPNPEAPSPSSSVEYFRPKKPINPMSAF